MNCHRKSRGIGAGWHGVLLLILAISALLVAWRFWNNAFPFASVDFRVSRTNAGHVLRERVEAIAGPLAGYKSAVLFGRDEKASNYLELELGIPKLEELTSRGLDVHYWYGRWFRPEQKEEFKAWISPEGNLVGYSHIIEENRALPSPGKAGARKIAEEFLEKNVPHHPLESLEFLSSSDEAKPNRTDIAFEWKAPSLHAGEADYRLRVLIQGDEVGEYGEHLKVPESWERSFAKRRSLNGFLQSLAVYATMPLGLGTMALLIFYLTRHRLRGREAVPGRWLILAGIMALLSLVHELPKTFSAYPTTQDWGSYLFQTVSGSACSTVVMLLGFWLLTLVADVLYREMQPQRLPFNEALGRGALSRPETVRALGIGVMFACIGIGYVTLFYVVGRHFGAWSPVEIDYSKTLSGWLPWAAGLEAGLSAAWIEELFFRVIAILLYWKIFRHKWIAVLLSAITWGFLHSNYPQMPGYIRGVELTLAGILWGWVFLRYGIVATLTTHYLFNCWLTCVVVVQSGDWWNIVGAIVVSLWPVAAWIRGRGMLRDVDLSLTHHAPTPENRPPAPGKPLVSVPANRTTPWDFSIRVFDRKTLLTLLATGAVMIAVSQIVLHHYQPFGDFGKLDLTRTQIASRADEILRERGFDPAEYRRVVKPDTSGLPSKYLLEIGNLKEVAAMYGTEWPDVKWGVRYFRPGETQEFRLELTKNGSLYNWYQRLPREAPGASLDSDAAKEIAISHLRELRGFNADDEKLIATDVTEQTHRRDYRFTFERNNWNWGESNLRTAVTIAGDKAVFSSHFIKIPDEWVRAQAKTGWRKAIQKQMRLWKSLIIILLGCTLIVFLARRHLFQWKAAFLSALFPATLVLVSSLNNLPLFWKSYNTVKPLDFYVITKTGELVLGIIVAYLGETLRLAITLGIVHWAFGWRLSDLRLPASCADWRAAYFRRILVIAVFVIGIWTTRNALNTSLSWHLTPEYLAHASIPAVSGAVPWLSSTVSALKGSYNFLLGNALLISLGVILYRRHRKLVWVLVFALPVFTALTKDTPADMLYSFATGELNWLLTLFLFWKIFRFDVIGTLVVYAVASLITAATVFIEKGGAGYAIQAWPLLASIPLVLGIPFLKAKSAKEHFTLRYPR